LRAPAWAGRRRRGIGRGLVVLLAAATLPGAGRAAGHDAVLSAWFGMQTNLQSWSAEVTQTRTLKALTQPLTATGRVWFAAPGRFRWELGEPAQTIAVREPDQMLVIYPRLKRVERYPLTGSAAERWHELLALIDAGFPTSAAELESRFRVLSTATTNDTRWITLEPRAASARKLLPEIGLVLALTDGSLLGTQLRFADGSVLRNDFTHAKRNPPLDEALFHPAVPPDFTVVEPGEGR
jgi:outer membrane lipoprotein-sorting protein